MRYIKNAPRPGAKVSLILLDWSVRESFHIFHYLSNQTVSREEFEVILIEYYDTISKNAQKYEAMLDIWVTLDMPRACYYHKHFMYNVGIVLANSEILMIGDSDAMVRPTFIETIIRAFDADAEIVYHMDQFRNMRRDFYPFNFPSFESVLGDGCFNNAGGVTKGILETEDPIHARNYGACMCAHRQDVIAIGGADMHIHYLGHICGPYDMTFRLINYGRREIWESEEFLYHTWHPGQAGADNYMGPHDGRHMSTTALEALSSGRVTPFLENPAIAALRAGASREAALAAICPDHYRTDWDIEAIRSAETHTRWDTYKRPQGTYKGFRIVAEVDRVFAYPLTERDAETRSGQGHHSPIDGPDIDAVRAKIDAATPSALNHLARVGLALSLGRRAVASFAYRASALPLPLPRPIKILAVLPLVPVVLTAMLVFRYRRFADRVAAVTATPTHDDAGPTTLAATLYNLVKWGEVPGDARSVLLVTHETTRDCLRVLRWFGLIPAFRIEVVPSPEAENFGDVLAALERDDSLRCLLLPAALHGRHYAAVAASHIGKHCLVL